MHVHVQDVSSYKEEEGPNILSYIQSNPVSQPGFFMNMQILFSHHMGRFTLRVFFIRDYQCLVYDGNIKHSTTEWLEMMAP